MFSAIVALSITGTRSLSLHDFVDGVVELVVRGRRSSLVFAPLLDQVGGTLNVPIAAAVHLLATLVEVVLFLVALTATSSWSLLLVGAAVVVVERGRCIRLTASHGLSHLTQQLNINLI